MLRLQVDTFSDTVSDGIVYNTVSFCLLLPSVDAHH